MDIKNANKVMDLIKRKSNVENLVDLLNEFNNCSVIISAKAEDSKGRFVFLDEQAVIEAKSLLQGMQHRIENELRKL